MSTFAEQLKNEIARIARKESRADSKQIKKASTQYRAEIAALKRRIANLESALARLAKQQVARHVQEKNETEVTLRFRANGFASLRKKLGLTAHEMAQLIGVSAQSVYHWENGKSRPRASQLLAISAVRKISKKEAREKLARS
jgi:DNA-binding XRE family transcriptional regulator